MAPWAPRSRRTYPPAAALEHKRSALIVKSENENNTSHVDNSDDTDEKKSVMSLFCPSAHLDGEVALGHAMVILKERRQSLEKSR